MRNDANLFDDVTVARLERRYGHWRSQDRPRLWLVATAGDHAELRHWLQTQLDSLDGPGRARLTGKLRDPNSFSDAYHELCVAALLRDSGQAVSYEPDLDGVTPDLVVPGTDSRPVLIVEVWTRNRPDTAIGAQRQWLVLQQHLEQIPVGVRLLVVDAPIERSAPADSALVKRISRSVRDWLLSPLTSAHMVHTVEGYTFAIVGRLPTPRVQFAAPSGAGSSSDADQILAALAVKVSRYRSVVERSGAELLVVAAAGDGAALSHDVLRDTLAGRNVVSMSFTPYDVGIIGQSTVQLRATEEPPNLDPCLSAVGWLDADPRVPPGRMTLFPNPGGVRPLRELTHPSIHSG